MERNTNRADKNRSKIIVASVNTTREAYLPVHRKTERKIIQKGGRPMVYHGRRLSPNERNELMFFSVGGITIIYYNITV